MPTVPATYQEDPCFRTWLAARHGFTRPTLDAYVMQVAVAYVKGYPTARFKPPAWSSQRAKALREWREYHETEPTPAMRTERKYADLKAEYEKLKARHDLIISTSASTIDGLREEVRRLRADNERLASERDAAIADASSAFDRAIAGLNAARGFISTMPEAK